MQVSPEVFLLNVVRGHGKKYLKEEGRGDEGVGWWVHGKVWERGKWKKEGERRCKRWEWASHGECAAENLAKSARGGLGKEEIGKAKEERGPGWTERKMEKDGKRIEWRATGSVLQKISCRGPWGAERKSRVECRGGLKENLV
jgi:hypothetical protein